MVCVFPRQKIWFGSLVQPEKILQNDPQDLSALNNKGYTLSKLKRYDAAIECYNRSLQIKPDDKLVQINIISVYRKTGRIDYALELCNKILEKNPDELIVLYH